MRTTVLECEAISVHIAFCSFQWHNMDCQCLGKAGMPPKVAASQTLGESQGEVSRSLQCPDLKENTTGGGHLGGGMLPALEEFLRDSPPKKIAPADPPMLRCCSFFILLPPSLLCPLFSSLRWVRVGCFERQGPATIMREGWSFPRSCLGRWGRPRPPPLGVEHNWAQQELWRWEEMLTLRPHSNPSLCKHQAQAR